jgi:hypothetical protein
MKRRAVRRTLLATTSAAVVMAALATMPAHAQNATWIRNPALRVVESETRKGVLRGKLNGLVAREQLAEILKPTQPRNPPRHWRGFFCFAHRLWAATMIVIGARAHGLVDRV